MQGEERGKETEARQRGMGIHQLINRSNSYTYSMDTVAGTYTDVGPHTRLPPCIINWVIGYMTLKQTNRQTQTQLIQYKNLFVTLIFRPKKQIKNYGDRREKYLPIKKNTSGITAATAAIFP